MDRQHTIERITDIGQSAAGTIQKGGELALRATGNMLTNAANSVPITQKKEAWYRRPRNIIMTSIGAIGLTAAGVNVYRQRAMKEQDSTEDAYVDLTERPTTEAPASQTPRTRPEEAQQPIPIAELQEPASAGM